MRHTGEPAAISRRGAAAPPCTSVATMAFGFCTVLTAAVRARRSPLELMDAKNRRRQITKETPLPQLAELLQLAEQTTRDAAGAR